MGQRRREIFLLGQFRARAYKRPLLDSHFPKRVSEDPRTSASRSKSPQPEISPICVAKAPPPCDKQNPGTGQTVEPNSERRIHGVRQVLAQGPMGSFQGIIQPVDGCPRFPKTARFLGIPFTRSTKINIAIKAIRPGEAGPDIQATHRPLCQGTQRYHLQTRGSAAYGSRNIRIAHAKIWALITFGY